MKTPKNALLYIGFITTLLFLFVLAFSLAVNEKGVDLKKVALNFIFNFPMCLLLGYIDYKVIVYRQTKKDTYGIGKALTTDFLLTTLIVVPSSFIVHVLFTSDINIFMQLIPSVLLNCIIVMFIEILLYNQRQIENKMRLNRAEKEKAIYQFEVLKSQINPHFLFNSLNVLSSLVYHDAEKANLFVKNLSNIYRYLLTTQERSTVELEEELHFVKSYMFLEEIRFEENLIFHIENDKNMQHKKVIPASLQMLVENAIKHNISTSESPLIIHISINENGAIVSNNLQLRNYVVRNGIGLKNLEKQYAVYGKKIKIISGRTKFIVIIPFID
ncbi:MAG: histidine kinase [Bacteroidales bacterium]|nr:histidine kinase [Bacteroidales bacterium]